MKHAAFVQCHVVDGMLVDHYRLFPSYQGVRDVLIHTKHSTLGRLLDVDVYQTDRTGLVIYRHKGNTNGAMMRIGGVMSNAFFTFFNYKQTRSMVHGPQAR